MYFHPVYHFFDLLLILSGLEFFIFFFIYFTEMKIKAILNLFSV